MNDCVSPPHTPGRPGIFERICTWAVVKWDQKRHYYWFFTTKFINWVIFNVLISTLIILLPGATKFSYFDTTEFIIAFLSYNFMLVATSLYLIVDSLRWRTTSQTHLLSVYVMSALFWALVTWALFMMWGGVDPKIKAFVLSVISKWTALGIYFGITMLITSYLFTPIIRAEYNDKLDQKTPSPTERQLEAEKIEQQAPEYLKQLTQMLENDPEDKF